MRSRDEFPGLHPLKPQRFQMPNLFKVGFRLHRVKFRIGCQMNASVGPETGNDFCHERHGVPSFIQIVIFGIRIRIEKKEIVDRMVAETVTDPGNRIGMHRQKIGKMVVGESALKFSKLVARLFNGYEIAIRVCLSILNRMQAYPTTNFHIERLLRVDKIDAVCRDRYALDTKWARFA